MRETQARRVQKDAAERREQDAPGARCARRAVERVAHQRMAGGGEVRANLMRAAGARLGRDQREVSQAQQHAPVRARLAPGASRAVMRVRRRGSRAIGSAIVPASRARRPWSSAIYVLCTVRARN